MTELRRRMETLGLIGSDTARRSHAGCVLSACLCSCGAATKEKGLRLGVADLNVQETENIIFDGAHAAGARINLDAPPRPVSSTPCSRVNADIMDPQLVELR